MDAVALVAQQIHIIPRLSFRLFRLFRTYSRPMFFRGE